MKFILAKILLLTETLSLFLSFKNLCGLLEINALPYDSYKIHQQFMNLHRISQIVDDSMAAYRSNTYSQIYAGLSKDHVGQVAPQKGAEVISFAPFFF
jgi:hypothetical protein